MNWSNGFRQTHRVLSMVFLLTVVANIVANITGRQAVWIGIMALIPLIFLMITGLYLFVLPYAAKWRSAKGRVPVPSE